MKLFDAHCDALLKMHNHQRLSFRNAEELQVNLERLQHSHAQIQCFAIFIPDEVPPAMKFQTAIALTDIFYERIIQRFEQMKLVTSKKQMDELQADEIGAILTIEGCDAIDVDLSKLRTLYRLGVTSVGLTWNNANACADGALEPRGAGLTDFGRRVVEENNKHRVWTDVSHLPEAGFWDVMALADFPIASHSNARALHDHPRNLYDEQIKALLKNDGVIGLTFVAEFLTSNKADATIDDILRHVEHVCELGGEKQLGFGSDFDGTEKTPEGLAHYGHYTALIEALLKHYTEETVQGFCFHNFARNFPR